MSRQVDFVFVANWNGMKGTVVLQHLAKSNFLNPGNCLVITNKPNGTIQHLAQGLGFECVFSSGKELFKVLSEIEFDYLISCGWNYKVSSGVLKLAKKHPINCHSAILPDYKGASTHKHAWANCEKYTGTTIHLMTADFDQGNIIEQERVAIGLFDTPASLIKKIGIATAKILPLAIQKLEGGELGVSQANKYGRYFLRIDNKRLFAFRVYNLFASVLGLKKKLTPFKS